MNSKILLFIIIIMAACFTQLASDIYTPSLPAIAGALHAPVELVQWSLAIYLLGVALSQLIYGPLSDGIGRKPPLIIGFSIIVVGSIICASASNIYFLIAGRFVQGCGAGACAALWRSVFRDVFTGEELAKYGSYFVLLIMFIIPAAPVLGGYLQEYSGWRANFIFMSAYSLLALIAVVLGFKESNQHHHLDKLKLDFISQTFKQLLTSPVFMGITACTFLSYGAFFAWFTTGPILLIKEIGLSPVQFGWITCLGGGIAYGLAGYLNGKLVTRCGMPTMLRFGFAVMIVSGLLMLIGKLLMGLNAAAIVIPIILFYFGSTFIWPNAFATAFTPFGKIAGYAGAVYGFMQISGGAAMGALMSFLPTTNQVPLGAVMLFASLAAWLLYEVVVLYTPKT